MKRFDYAWDWFKVHAKQRTDVFNYFLLITGLLANAYVHLRKDGHWITAGSVAITGLFTSAGFYLLDIRNKFLVNKAAKVLDVIEQDLLFNTDPFKELGLSQRRLDQIDPGKSDRLNDLFRHGTIFRGVYVAVGIMWLVFFGGVILFWLRTAGYTRKIDWGTALLIAGVQIGLVCLMFVRVHYHRRISKEETTRIIPRVASQAPDQGNTGPRTQSYSPEVRSED